MKKIWNSIRTFFKSFFDKSKVYIEKYVEPSIRVVEEIKKILDGKELKFILELIPGDLDNSTAAKINQLLPQILLYLRLANECTNLDSNEKIVHCAIEALRRSDKDGQKAFYLNIASMLATYLSDGKLQWSEAVILAQYTYEEKFKK